MVLAGGPTLLVNRLLAGLMSIAGAASSASCRKFLLHLDSASSCVAVGGSIVIAVLICPTRKLMATVARSPTSILKPCICSALKSRFSTRKEIDAGCYGRELECSVPVRFGLSA